MLDFLSDIGYNYSMFDKGVVMYLQTKNEMINEKNTLMVERMKMDRFFTMFLDKVGSQMKEDKTDTPVWKLYRSKMKEYDKLESQIKYLDYKISRV